MRRMIKGMIRGELPRSTTAPKSATASKNTAEHRRIKSKLEQREAEPPIAPMALSIRQFCIAHDLSIDKFYLMNREGSGPETMRHGGRTLISVEAAAAWRREREIASKVRTRPEMSDSDIAAVIGVSAETVSRARKKFAALEQQRKRKQAAKEQRKREQAAEAGATSPA